MKRIITFLALTIGFLAQAQHFSWLQTVDIEYDINPGLIGYVTATDKDGNIYLSGFKEEYSLDSADVTGHLFYNKYDSTGGLLFTKVFTGTAAVYDLKTDSKGNALLALMYEDTVTIGSLTLTSAALETSHVLLKFDPQGNLLWHRLISIEGVEEWNDVADFRAIALDAEDNIYIGYGNFAGCYITKFSTAGKEQFTIEQLNVNRLTSLSIDSLGNIYAAGSCAGLSSSFGGTDVTTSFLYNTYAVKYNAQGEFQWIKFVEDITCPEPEIIAVNPDEVYFSSYLFGSLIFDDIETEGPTMGMMSDFFLSKLNGQGQYQWVREVPGEGEISLAGKNFMETDNHGNIYIAGNMRWSIDWGNDIVTTIEGFTEDALILKYNSDGEIQAAKTAGGDNYDRFDGIAAAPSGDVYISGMSMGGLVHFDDIEHESPDFDTYPFLVKMQQETLGVNKPDANSGQFTLYPNPADDYIHISGTESVNGSVYTLSGQKVMDVSTSVNAPINIENLATGFYLLKISGFSPKKFIKQ